MGFHSNLISCLTGPNDPNILLCQPNERISKIMDAKKWLQLKASLIQCDWSDNFGALYLMLAILQVLDAGHTSST